MGPKFDYGYADLKFYDDSYVSSVWKRVNIVYGRSIYPCALEESNTSDSYGRIFEHIVNYYSGLSSEEKDTFDSNVRNIIKLYSSGTWSAGFYSSIKKHVDIMLRFFRTGQFGTSTDEIVVTFPAEGGFQVDPETPS